MNPDIADVLFLTTYLDSWGSGVDRILEACAEENVPAPHYEIRPESVVLVFPRPAASNDVSINVPDNVTVNVLEDNLCKLTERQGRIL